MGALLAGRSPYAVDMVCASLMNMEPMNVLMLKEAAERGLCPTSLEEIQVLGEKVASLRAEDFLQPESKTSNFIEKLPKSPPAYGHPPGHPLSEKSGPSSVWLRQCAESCPQHTITVAGSRKKAKLTTAGASAAIAATKCARPMSSTSSGCPCLICKGGKVHRKSRNQAEPQGFAFLFSVSQLIFIELR